MTITLEQLAAEPAQAALCLDFDGSLAPIVADPEQAAPLPGTAELLAGLARRYAAVALVSGRPAADLYRRVPVPGVRYLGLYGMEKLVDGRPVAQAEASARAPALRAALAELAAHAAVRGAGAHLEDKGLGVALHLRRVPEPQRWAAALEAAAREVAARHGLEVLPGRLVWELRPPTGHDKGAAVRRVVAESGARRLLVAGDDVGDLAAFRAVAELAGDGVEGLRVAVRSPEAPPELLAQADIVVDGPPGLHALLARLQGP